MRRVVVVDDDRSIRELLRAWLELEGFATATAADGTEAVTLLAASEAPAVVLMDVMMPRMNGREACRRVAALPGGERFRVALMTAGYADEVETPCPARALLRKPFNFDELVSVVEALARELEPLPVVAAPLPAHSYSPISIG